MELQVGVKIFIKKDDKFLILKRNIGKYKEIKNLWDIPGGRIKIGFSLIENLKREVKEETNLDIFGQPKLIFAQDIIKNDKHVVRLTYIGEAEGEFILDNTENIDFKWLTIEEIYKFDGFCDFAKEVLEKKLMV